MSKQHSNIFLKLFFLVLFLIPLGPASAQEEKSRVENPEALRPFLESLVKIKTGQRTDPVRVIQYGDSHTAADIMTSMMKRNFQRDFGPAIEGRGGVQLYILGVNGMRASKLATWSGEMFARNVSDYKPDLIILAYGTNEVTDGNWTSVSYQEMLSGIIRNFKGAAPQASVLVLGPPDRMVVEGGKWVPVKRMAQLIDAQRQASFDEGAAFWSASRAMGGDGSMALWFSKGLAQPGMVHLTRDGYILLAKLFYNDFALTYNEFIAGGSNPRPKNPDPAPSRILGRSIRFHQDTGTPKP
jgi:lysophospholipase L1-like esterase